MTQEKPTEDEMRKTPLTKESFYQESRSAHHFWKRELRSECHASEKLFCTYIHPDGVIEMRCGECKEVIGFVAVKEK